MAHEEIDLQQSELLEQLVEDKQWDRLRDAITDMDPADVADFIENLDEDDRSGAFQVLDDETAALVLAEVAPHVHEDVLEELHTDKIADIVEHMAPDDSADLLDALDEEKSAEVLAAMEPEERNEVLPLLSFDEDSAGHIMTPEMCQMPAHFTVEQTRNLMRNAEETIDPIIYVFVVDPRDRKLLGMVSMAELFVARPGARLGDICARDYVYSTSNEDQQDVARKFRKYDVWVMPVVDDEHRLIGRITVDDIVDVIHEEADEDLAHMVGAPDIETEEEAPSRIARQRLPWLLITMFAGLANSVVIKFMLNTTNQGVLAIFVPAILAMGGNTGMQSSAIAVRGIALGVKKYTRLGHIVLRELSVGLLMGVICGVVTGSIVLGVLLLTHADTGGVSPQALGLSVGIAMTNAMIFASGFGAITPIVLHRLGIDPAIASGPFVTTSNDLSASCIYFMTCLTILKFV